MKKYCFKYSEKDRIVLVTEENEFSIKGYDLSYFEKEKIESILESVNCIDPAKWMEDESLKELDLSIIKNLGLNQCFRHFKKEKISG